MTDNVIVHIPHGTTHCFFYFKFNILQNQRRVTALPTRPHRPRLRRYKREASPGHSTRPLSSLPPPRTAFSAFHIGPAVINKQTNNGLKSKVGLAAAKAAALRGSISTSTAATSKLPGSFVTVFARLPYRFCPLSQFAHATRTLVRGGPTRTHRLRLVASHRTRPPSSLPPPRTAFT